MATPAEIMAAVDTRLDQLRPAIAAHQDAYAAAHNGRRWQGLRSRDDAPSDGVEQLDTVNSTTPTDQPVEWPAVIHQPLPMAMTVDCYDGPHGQGYVMTSEVVIGGESYRRSENVGPETYRDADWAKVVTVPFVGITVDPLVFSCTFNSIGIEARFTESPGHTADLFAVEYKKVGALAWSPAMPLWPARPTGGQPVAARGSILFCEPGTAYMVRVTVYSGAATMTLVGIATTRAENIPPASTLVPTHFVRLDGNDANTGTSNTAGGAWRTVRRALIAAPTGAVVQVGSGQADEWFVDSGYSNAAPGPRTLPITLVAPFPAVDDERREINHGHRTFIEGSTRAAPTGQTVSGMPTAPWQQVTLTGPLTGRSVSVWKWTGGAPGTISSLGYGADRTGEYLRAWAWATDTAVGATCMLTPSGWAEMSDPVNSLQVTWHWGFFQEGTDLYLRMRDGADPNGFWWSGTGAAGIALNGPDSRISGFVIRNAMNAIRGGPGMHRLVVDHNDMRMCSSGLRGSGSLPSGYAVDTVFEHNLVRDRGLRSRNQDLLADPSCPWGFVKQRLKLSLLGASTIPADQQFIGTNGGNKGKPFYISQRVGGRAEGTGYLNTGTRRSVSRFNTISGLFNGVGSENVGAPTAEDVYISAEADVHDNLFLDLADDATEPARSSSNWRVWDNRADHCISFMSTGGPCAYGPFYVVNNTGWRIGNRGISQNTDGLDSLNGDQEGYVWKFDGSATTSTQPQARLYDVGNTFWSDDLISHGGSPAAGAGNRPEAFYRRNSIYRVVKDVIDYFPDPIGNLDEDYLHWCAASPSARFFRISPTKGNVGFTTWAEYRADMPTNNVHSNVANQDPHDATWLDAQFVDATHGDLRLKPDSALRGLGVYVPNLSTELAPNLGAP